MTKFKKVASILIVTSIVPSAACFILGIANTTGDLHYAKWLAVLLFVVGFIGVFGWTCLVSIGIGLNG